MTLNKLRKKFGFHKDNSGIMSRYLFEEENWNSHLKNTKEFILKNAADKQKGVCLILGSGWCLDIPLEELTQMFRRVILADIIHPRQIEHKRKKFSNLEFLTVDISGMLEIIYDYNKDKKRKDTLLNEIENQDRNTFINEINPDFVVSANILSQISYFPTEFIKKNKTDVSETELKSIQKIIEKNHIDTLPKGKSVLISDYFEEEYSSNGRVINKKSRLAVTLPKGKVIREWIWNFDASGNYETGNPVRFKVAALQV